MRTAAELDREFVPLWALGLGNKFGNRCADRDDAHGVWVTLAENRANAADFTRFRERYFTRVDREIRVNRRVHALLDFRNLRERKRSLRCVIEAQLLIINERTLLFDFVTSHCAQREIQRVRRRVIRANRIAAITREHQLAGFAATHTAVLEATNVQDVLARALHVFDFIDGIAARSALDVAAVTMCAIGAEGAVVGNLSTHLGVHRRLVKDEREQRRRISLDVFIEVLAVPNRHQRRGGGLAGELPLIVGWFDVQFFELRNRIRREVHARFAAACGARLLARGFHQRFVARDIDGESRFFGHHLREVDREAPRVVQTECIFCSDRATACRFHTRGGVREKREATFECLSELDFFLFDQLRDALRSGREFRECAAEARNNRRHEILQERPAHAERLVAVTHGATQDAT